MAMLVTGALGTCINETGLKVQKQTITPKFHWFFTLARWLRWLEHRCTDRKVMGLTPCQGTYPGG